MLMRGAEIVEGVGASRMLLVRELFASGAIFAREGAAGVTSDATVSFARTRFSALAEVISLLLVVDGFNALPLVEADTEDLGLLAAALILPLPALPLLSCLLGDTGFPLVVFEPFREDAEEDIKEVEVTFFTATGVMSCGKMATTFVSTSVASFCS